jgi:hypothetical protein
VKVGDGKDLVNDTLRNVDQMDLGKISKTLNDTVTKIREKKLTTHNQKMNVVKLVPTLYFNIKIYK